MRTISPLSRSPKIRQQAPDVVQSPINRHEILPGHQPIIEPLSEGGRAEDETAGLAEREETSGEPGPVEIEEVFVAPVGLEIYRVAEGEFAILGGAVASGAAARGVDEGYGDGGGGSGVGDGDGRLLEMSAVGRERGMRVVLGVVFKRCTNRCLCMPCHDPWVENPSDVAPRQKTVFSFCEKSVALLGSWVTFSM